MTLALVYVNCFPEGQASAEMHVRKVDGVVESYSTSGAYDMILKVKAETITDLRVIIKNVMRVPSPEFYYFLMVMPAVART
jgi:DNA-binding Lrp family transcriptional regulator